jgi:hypothetical protein
VEKIRNSHLQKIKKGSGVHGEVSTPSAVAHFSKKKYSVAIDLVALKMTTFEEKSQSPPTLLEQYIASKDLDFKDIVGMACDVLLAGMDTVNCRVRLKHVTFISSFRSLIRRVFCCTTWEKIRLFRTHCTRRRLAFCQILQLL